MRKITDESSNNKILELIKSPFVKVIGEVRLNFSSKAT